MSNRIDIGSDASGRSLVLELSTLIETRSLITGNSGSGKSRLLRRLAEQAFGKVQIILLDPEGEFGTLRERHDFLLAGRNGEVQAEPRAAALLARRLMELSLSAVIDLYGLPLQGRRSFVRLFLESLLELDKNLYAPVLVILDEAHVFCPEKSESEAASAVIDLMARGRKRGLCGILATQRLSKLDKDAAAEAKNYFIGGIALDVDQKRAADVLGFSGRDERIGLRDLPPGRFLGFGPALSQKGVTEFTSGDVLTTHPKAGQRHKLGVTPTPEAIRKVQAELKDLPQQAAEEIRTLEAAQARIKILEREVRTAKATTTLPTREVSVVTTKMLKRIESLARILEIGANRMTETGLGIGRAREEIIAALQKACREGEQPVLSTKAPGAFVPPAATITWHRGVIEKGPGIVPPRTTVRSESGDMPGTQRAILNMVATLDCRGIPADRIAVARWLGIHPNGGRFLTDIARLREGGYLDGFRLTDAGSALAFAGTTGVDSLVATIRGHKQAGSRAKMMEKILENGGFAGRVDLAAALGIHPNGGRFLTDLARLREMGVIPERGEIKPTQAVFA